MGSPKKSATLAATAAKVGSVPSETPRSMAGDHAKSGTYSREWSVEEVVGSQPWSAVMSSKSSLPSAAMMSGSALSNCSSARP